MFCCRKQVAAALRKRRRAWSQLIRRVIVAKVVLFEFIDGYSSSSGLNARTALIAPATLTASGSKGSVVFSIVAKFFSFFLCCHDNSWTAALSLMKFCANMYLDNFYKPFKFQCHRSKVKVTLVFVRFCVHDTAWTSWPGFTECCMARGQYLATPKAWRTYLFNWWIIDIVQATIIPGLKKIGLKGKTDSLLCSVNYRLYLISYFNHDIVF